MPSRIFRLHFGNSPASSTDGSGVQYPLLSAEDTSRPTTPDGSSPRRAPSPRHRRARRHWMRTLLLVLVPAVLVVGYSFLTPHFPEYLPPLPKVKIEHGGANTLEAPGEVHTEYFSPSMCVCGETEVGKKLCDVYHQQGLQASRLVRTSGARTRRLLTKAREQQAIKIGVLGGSVSACHGVHPSPQYPKGDPNGPGCYTMLVKRWFEDTFPGTTVESMNGAIGGSDSSYYAFCGTHHIPTDVDLIILEFDVNDQTDLTYQHFFDQLLRVLLEFESQPAVVILGAWAPQVAQDQGYADPQTLHVPVASYYDIPYISLKQVIFNHYTRFPHSTVKTFFQPDRLHPNARGHRLLGDLLIAYFESELCMLSHYGLPTVPPLEDTIATSNDASSLIDVSFDIPEPVGVDIDWSNPPDGWDDSFDSDRLQKLGDEKRHFALPQTPYAVPFVSMFSPLRDVINPSKADPSGPSHILDLVQPAMFCADANDRKHPMQPTEHDGWEPFVWNNEKHYWVSSTVGAKIRVDIEVNAGRVAVSYFRSQHYNLGDALCWVDDNKKGAVKLAGYWEKAYNVAVVSYIDQNVTTGAHYVTCEIADETSHPHNEDAHHFRIVAVMAT